MRKWKCTVCGYIHTGDEAPEKCPVCGAPQDRFVEVDQDGTPKPAPVQPAREPSPTADAEIKKWKCTACGYIHTGSAPPEKCPVCGASQDRFEEVAEAGGPEPSPAAPTREPSPAAQGDRTPSPPAGMEAATETDIPDQTAPPESPSWFRDSKYRPLFDMMTKYHGHPISVHIPNGLLPVSVLFIFLSALFNLAGMASVATYNLGVVALSMPLVLFSGWVDWQNRFNGARTTVFNVKITCGIIVTTTAWLLFIWLLVNPEVVTTAQASRVVFLMINLIMLGAAGTAGWYGGKLVFRD